MQPPSEGWIHSLYVPAHINPPEPTESPILKRLKVHPNPASTETPNNMVLVRPQFADIKQGVYTVPVSPCESSDLGADCVSICTNLDNEVMPIINPIPEEENSPIVEAGEYIL